MGYICGLVALGGLLAAAITLDWRYMAVAIVAGVLMSLYDSPEYDEWEDEDE